MQGQLKAIKLLLSRSGPYSRSKYKVLSLLDSVWQASRQNGGSDYLTIKRIAVYTGIPYYSLGKLLKRYIYYGYIEGRACGEVGAPYSEGYSEYSIKAKGQKWLRKAETDLRNAGQFSKELSDQIDKARPLVNDLLRLPFKDFLHELKALSAPEKE